MKTIIVAGITRSGLTMVIQMLNAGGYPCNGTYPAFEDNENQIKEGFGNKLVDTHQCFPQKGNYYIIRLNRDRYQQTKSIVKLLRNIAGIFPSKLQQTDLRKSLAADYKKIDDWGKRQHGFMELHFENIINDPLRAANMIKSFIDYPLDIQKMINVVIKRSPDCTDKIYEYQMV